MSTRPGNHNKKKPAQKHKNVTAFKFDKYKTDAKAKTLKTLQVFIHICVPRVIIIFIGGQLLSEVHRSHRMEDQVREVQNADHAC